MRVSSKHPLQHHTLLPVPCVFKFVFSSQNIWMSPLNLWTGAHKGHAGSRGWARGQVTVGDPKKEIAINPIDPCDELAVFCVRKSGLLGSVLSHLIWFLVGLTAFGVSLVIYLFQCFFRFSSSCSQKGNYDQSHQPARWAGNALHSKIKPPGFSSQPFDMVSSGIDTILHPIGDVVFLFFIFAFLLSSQKGNYNQSHATSWQCYAFEN